MNMYVVRHMSRLQLSKDEWCLEYHHIRKVIKVMCRWLSLGQAAAGPVAVSPAGSLVAVAATIRPHGGSLTADVGIQLWSAASGAHLRSLHAQHCHAVQVCAFTADDHMSIFRSQCGIGYKWQGFRMPSLAPAI